MSRSGGKGRAGRAGAGRHAEGAAPRRVPARPGAPGLRDQSGPARVDRTGRWQHLHRRHGADGSEQGRLDRGDRVVRPQQFRQHRIGRSRRPMSRECGRRPAIEARHGPLTKSKRRCPFSWRHSLRGRRPRATTPRPPRTRWRRHVDDRRPHRPGCGSRSSFPRPRRSPRSSSCRRRDSAAGEPRRRGAGRPRVRAVDAEGPGTPGRAVRLLGPGFDGWQHVEHARRGRSGLRQEDGDSVQAGRGEVRPHHADRNSRQRVARGTLQRLRLYQLPKRTPQ